MSKEVLIEYPEFVLRGKRNFILFTNVEKTSFRGAYLRNAHHSPNLLFLKKKPARINDILVYPIVQKNFEKINPFLATLIQNSGKPLKGKYDIKNVKINSESMLYFSFFTAAMAELTLKSLYYMHDTGKKKFLFWYSSLATILQTSFAYLLTKGIFEINPEKILDEIRKYGFKNIDFVFIKKEVKSQKIKNVEKIFRVACNFTDQLCQKVLEENKI